MKEKNKPSGSEILLYSTEDGKAKIEVRLENETVWLSQSQMVELFQTTKQNISLHIRNIFNEGELQENSVVKEYLTTASDMKDYNTKFYNLDVIISVGYRVKSYRGTQFRIWATQQLREYIVKGFVLNDERLKQDKHFGNLLSLFTTKSRDASPGRLRDGDTGINLSLQTFEIVDGLPGVRWE
jgi:hypothetical protein